MNSILRSLSLTSLLGVLILATGCANVVIKNPKTAFAGYTATEKVDLKVGLQITDDLRKPEWKKDNLIIRPGDYLATNSLFLAQHVFREVVPATEESPAGVDAVLKPKLVYINRTRGATSFGESITSVKVEWNMSDPAGKPVWIETITGEGRGSTGWTAPEKTLKAALDELLLKSQQAMANAPTLRAYGSRAKNAAVTR